MSRAKKSIFSGILLVVDALMKRLIGLISTLILARVLTPEDFGVVAIAMITLGFVQALAITGSEPYILQRKAVNDDIINSAWTLDVIFKSVVLCLLFIIAPWVSEYYDKPELVTVIRVISLIAIIGAVRNPGTWLLMREQNYKAIVKLAVFSKVISVVATIVIALVYQSYWALIFGHLISISIRSFGSYFIHQHKPKLCTICFKDQWSFSGWMTPQSILGYLRTQLDTILVSNFYGEKQLGSYHIMKYLAFMPTSELLNPATQPLLVELANDRDNKEKFQSQFEISMLATMLVALPIVGFLYTFDQLVVLLLLGEQWSAFSNLFGVLSLLVIAAVFFNQAQRVLLVYEKTKLIFLYELCSFIFIYSILLSIGMSDISSFTLSRVLIEMSLSFLLFAAVAYFTIGFVSLFRLIMLMLPLVASVFICLYLTSLFPVFELPYFFDLIIKSIIFFITYIFFIWGLYQVIYFRFPECVQIYSFICSNGSKLKGLIT